MVTPEGSAGRCLVALRDGTPLQLRPVGPDDREALQRGVEHDLSPESRYRRFLSPLHTLTPDLLDHLTGADGTDHVALGALAGVHARPAGVARYIRAAGNRDEAEVALTVADAWQGRGVGTVLLAALGSVALANGVRTFHADLLSDNLPVLAMLRRCGPAASMHSLEGLTEARLDLLALEAHFELALGHGAP
jgi:GNAT superfamily N-acetyltransferase